MSFSEEDIRLKEQTNSPEELIHVSKNIEKPKKSKKKRNNFIYVNVTQAYYPIVQEALKSIGYKITESDIKANLIWINQNGTIETASSLLFMFLLHCIL